METKILLARHAQSEWNEMGRWQGQADPPLTRLGRLQAGRAAERVGSVDAIFASDLDRAASTAVIISELIGVGPVLCDERLREREAGPWSGLTRAEIEEGWPGYLERGQRPDGYESDESVWNRVQSVMAELTDSWPGASLLVITHGGVIRTTLSRLDADRRRKLSNLVAFELRHRDGDGLRLGDRIELVDEQAAPGT